MQPWDTIKYLRESLLNICEGKFHVKLIQKEFNWNNLQENTTKSRLDCDILLNLRISFNDSESEYEMKWNSVEVTGNNNHVSSLKKHISTWMIIRWAES